MEPLHQASFIAPSLSHHHHTHILTEYNERERERERERAREGAGEGGAILFTIQMIYRTI